MFCYKKKNNQREELVKSFNCLKLIKYRKESSIISYSLRMLMKILWSRKVNCSAMSIADRVSKFSFVEICSKQRELNINKLYNKFYHIKLPPIVVNQLAVFKSWVYRGPPHPITNAFNDSTLKHEYTNFKYSKDSCFRIVLHNIFWKLCPTYISLFFLSF